MPRPATGSSSLSDTLQPSWNQVLLVDVEKNFFEKKAAWYREKKDNLKTSLSDTVTDRTRLITCFTLRWMKKC